MNGKGDKLRHGANLKIYRDNYDQIFNKKKCEMCQGCGTVLDSNCSSFFFDATEEKCDYCEGKGYL